MIEKDITKKTYPYFSRYGTLNTLFDTKDKKRYYETSRHINKNIDRFVVYTVKINDNLDSIALKHYGNPLYWWIIADFNSLQDIFELKEGTILKLPYFNQVTFE